MFNTSTMEAFGSEQLNKDPPSLPVGTQPTEPKPSAGPVSPRSLLCLWSLLMSLFVTVPFLSALQGVWPTQGIREEEERWEVGGGRPSVEGVAEGLTPGVPYAGQTSEW